MERGILLYGPPASGKDTITSALADLDRRYVPFTRLKVGTGRTHGYRMASREHLRQLEERDEVVYRNDRYGNIYVVDRPGLREVTSGGRVPVVHLGQIAGVRAVADGFAARWWRVLLWCPRAITGQRSFGRGDGDTAARLAAWDATERDVADNPGIGWDLVVHTGGVSPRAAAERIHAVITAAG
ncbi:guanylate kinase [Streptomyces sp. SID4919]|uniref:guanylate kinase n=1 Tax=unclassified Streptomyces TaxID=2593676 RepID=UPI000823D94F|nr:MULTISPECIES: guanylate kinase [unclassified Streptomyces]MYY13489.1 guanylate kinase [Streptomyces sp. SID4919]SCK63122.1 guanylate kinase [Streptomyces sp. AmelKG-E11A]